MVIIMPILIIDN